MPEPILVVKSDLEIHLLPLLAIRNGLIAGATGYPVIEASTKITVRGILGSKRQR